MQATNRAFVALVNGNKQFVIPAFQRDYTWATGQCEQMWDDIVRVGRSEEGGHFMGSFVCVAGNAGPVFSSWLVIDGQQRLATLTILAIALRDHIQQSDWRGLEPTPRQIDAYFLTNEHESGDSRYKVSLRRHDDATLKALVDGKDPSDIENRSELLVGAYHQFRDLLSSGNVDPATIYRGIGRLNIVEVLLHRSLDDPQRVFESLNSTGVDLTQSDLIRNYLLMGLPEAEQTRMYDDHWSKVEKLFREAGDANPDTFLRDYIALKQGTSTQARADRIYAEFKDFYQPSDGEALAELLEDLVRFAGYFVAFWRPDRIDSKPLATAMAQVRSLGSAHAILTMRLYELYEEGTLSQVDFVRALNLIASYLVRRSVLGMQTRDYWSVFARMSHSMTEGEPFESFQVALARQSYRFPSDAEFVSAIQERDLYSLRIRLHILTQLENAGQKEPSPVSEYSIEHIMPQSIDTGSEWKCMLGDDWEEIQQEWLHRLGNLTLTAYNSSLSNRSFEEKKKVKGGFEQSAVRLNEYVRKKSRWTATEMEERGCILAQRAAEIWPHHNAEERLVLADELRDLRRRSAERHGGSLKMSASVRKILYEIRDSIRELGDSIEIVEGRSLCFYDAHSAGFFAETLPMAGYVRILLPIDFEEISDPEGVAKDVSAWKFLLHVTHRDCGVFVDVDRVESIPKAVSMVRHAFNVATE